MGRLNARFNQNQKLEVLLEFKNSKKYFQIGKLASETNRLFADLLDGQTGDPRGVKTQVNAFSGLFRGTAQEDAQEFLRWYLEGNILIILMEHKD